MKITFDMVTTDDSTDPVVLVVEWRDTEGNARNEHIFLEKIGSAKQSISRMEDTGSELQCGTGCRINDKFLMNGEIIEDDVLCIVIKCENGNVKFEDKLTCDIRKVRKEVVVFPGDFS